MQNCVVKNIFHMLLSRSILKDKKTLDTCSNFFNVNDLILILQLS